MARYIIPFITFLTLLHPSKLTAENKIPGDIIKEAVKNTLALNNVNATPVINEKKTIPKMCTWFKRKPNTPKLENGKC